MLMEPRFGLLLNSSDLRVRKLTGQPSQTQLAHFVSARECKVGPEVGFRKVHGHTTAIIVVVAESALGQHMTLISSAGEPPCGLSIVLLHTVPQIVTPAQ